MIKQNKIFKKITKQLYKVSWKFYMLVDMLPIWLKIKSISFETKLKLERTRKPVYLSTSKHMNRYIEVRC